MSDESEMSGGAKADPRDILPILEGWSLDPTAITAERIVGEDGLEQIQLRIPMGLLQMNVDGRPDGSRPDGFDSMLDVLRHLAEQEHKAPTSEQWFDLDREVMQYYHRRIALLQLAEDERRERNVAEAAKDYAHVVADADHNLSVMDFIRDQSDDSEYVGAHEQYRAFVLGHRTLGAGLYWICRDEPEAALDAILIGLKRLQRAYEARGDTDVMRRDPTAGRLVRLSEQLRKEYSIGRTLQEQLMDAVAAEDFEKAAKLRDDMRQCAERLRAPFEA